MTLDTQLSAKARVSGEWCTVDGLPECLISLMQMILV